MKKTYKIDVDCANCANKMEEAARKTEGVQSATVNFMALMQKICRRRSKNWQAACRNSLNSWDSAPTSA